LVTFHEYNAKISLITFTPSQPNQYLFNFIVSQKSSDIHIRRLFYGVYLRRRLHVYASAYAVSFKKFYVRRLRRRLFFSL